MAHFGKDQDNFSPSKMVQITGSETNENFTIYTIEVVVGNYTWTVKHRYSEFHELHEKLVLGCKLDKNLLPPKKLFGNQSEAFIKKRQQDLQVYLQTVLHYLAHHPPPALTFFLDFHLYEIHGITQALAEDLYNRGEMILQSKDVYHVTPLQLYALTERLKLPEPTCDSGDVKKDLGHILDFITRTKHLQIVGSNEAVGSSNIVMNQLTFDLSLFKSLQSLEVMSCNFQMVQGLETIKQTLRTFNVYRTASTVKAVALQDVPRWKAEDGTELVGGWDHVTHVDFSHNFLKEIDDSIQILWRVEQLNLSHNQLESLQHLQLLSQLTHLDLSGNKLHLLDSLHTKLGNIKCILLSDNAIESLHGFSKLFSLEVLDVSNNKIAKVEDVRPVCHLPCLERLQLTDNPITNTVDYRTKILEMFGERVEEVRLDQHKASQKEKDTVAVRLALQKARDAKLRQSGPRKNSSTTSLSDVYGGRGGTPPVSATVSFPSACETLPSGGDAARQSGSVISQYYQRGGRCSDGVSSSAPQHAPSPVHSLFSPDITPTASRYSGIFIPHRHSPSQTSVSSCAGAQAGASEGAAPPDLIPEAHPFDPSSEAPPLPSSPSRREFSAANLPDRTCKDFTEWLEAHLLSDLSTAEPVPVLSSIDSPPAEQETTDKIVDVMWCLCQQYSNLDLLFPCCAVLTTTKVIVERLCSTPRILGRGRCSLSIPDLRPHIVLPLGSVQHMVVGPAHSYVRLEEAFVGKCGLFTLFATSPSDLQRFAGNLQECCTQVDVKNPFDVLDISEISDLLRELNRREEERLGVTSDRLHFVSLVRMKTSGPGGGEEVKASLLALTQNVAYCLDTTCAYWPPATFETVHVGGIQLLALKELPINCIAVRADIPPSPELDQAAPRPSLSLLQGFTSFPLRVDLTPDSSQEPQRGHSMFLYMLSSSARQTFMDALTRLQEEQFHCQSSLSVREREAPEGGNEGMATGEPCASGDTDGNVIVRNKTQGNDSASLHDDTRREIRNGQPAQTVVNCLSACLRGGDGVCDQLSTTSTTKRDNNLTSEPCPDTGSKSTAYDRNNSHCPRAKIPTTITTSCSQPVSSLPSSYEWKGFYFKNNLASEVSPAPPVTAVTSTDSKKGLPEVSMDAHILSVQAEVYVSGLASIQSSGEFEEEAEIEAPSALEQELKLAARTYNLLHPMPARMRPISLMSGTEVVSFFHSKIAGSPSSCASVAGCESTAKASSRKMCTTIPEELRHALWTVVIPYCDPNREVVTFVMLSTRAIYLVSDSTLVNNTTPTTRPTWMTHNRHKSDSAVGWQTKPVHDGKDGGERVVDGAERPSSAQKMRGHQWGSQVKAYAVVPLVDLQQVSIGLFDQFLRLTGPDADSIFTLATRDSKETAAFVDKLKSLLSLLLAPASPSPGPGEQISERKSSMGATRGIRDKSPSGGEGDFYQAFFTQRTNSMVEGLVYTHPSQVTFVYPGDDAIDDVLFLIKAKLQARAPTSPTQNCLQGSSVGSGGLDPKDILWLYILAYQLLPQIVPPLTASLELALPEHAQARCVILTSHHLCLAREDIVTYPLPDFVRGLPEQPQHEVTETRPLESLKRVVLSLGSPRLLTLVFWDEPQELVVDTSMQHFGGGAGIGGAGSGPAGTTGGGASGKVGREIVPEVALRLFIQSPRDRDKLVQTLQKKWRELVPQVGRILDVVKE